MKANGKINSHIKFQPKPIHIKIWDTVDKKFLDDPSRASAITPTGGIVTRHDMAIVESTGVFDRNGEEIFNGDIIVDHGYLIQCVHKLVGYVSLSDIFAGYTILSPYSNYAEPSIVLSKVNNYEVIGNIFENPELLEEKNV